MRAAPLPEKTERAWLDHTCLTEKTLSGWTAPDDHGNWSMKDGVVTGTRSQRSHLFSPNTYTNLEFKSGGEAEPQRATAACISARRWASGWPKGYESQVENTSPDPQRTGSLYNFHKVGEQLIEDDTWWTQHVIAIGNHIIIKINDQIVTDFIDEKNSRMSQATLPSNSTTTAAW